MKLLIVEDEALIVWHLSDMAQALGLEVCGSASTEDSAVESDQALKPDLILMDVRLKKGDGTNAARRIRQARPVPIIFCTALADHPEFKARIADLPSTATVRKPADIEQLKRAVVQLFGHTFGLDVVPT
jgi:two-component system, response regulator PdtaR